MNDKELLKLVQADLDDARKVKDGIDTYVSRMRNIYEGRTEEKVDRGSNFVSREAFKQIEWVKAQLKNPFISNDTIARMAASGVSDREFAIQTEEVANHYYIKKFNRYNFTSDMLNILLIEGTLITRTGWEYKGVTTSVQVPVVDEMGNQVDVTTVEKEVPVVNKPTAVVVRNEDVYIDPTAYEEKDIQFLIL